MDNEKLACAVRFCRAEGTVPLEHEGAVLCFVCVEHKAEIESEDYEGWVLVEPSKACRDGLVIAKGGVR